MAAVVLLLSRAITRKKLDGTEVAMWEAIRRILGLTWKELLAVLMLRGRFTLLVPPVFQCLIYGYVATYDLNDVPYAVLDRVSQRRISRPGGPSGRLEGVSPPGRPPQDGLASRPRSMNDASCS